MAAWQDSERLYARVLSVDIEKRFGWNWNPASQLLYTYIHGLRLAIQDQVSFQHPYKVSSDAYQLAFKAYSYQGFPRNLDLRVVVQQLVKQIVLLKEDGQQSLQEQMPQVEEQLKHNNAQGQKLIKCYGGADSVIDLMNAQRESLIFNLIL